MNAPPSSRSASVSDPTGPVAALFDEHCGFVCRVLRHHGVHEASLDDAVQDVFVTAYRRWSSFEGRSSARSWLYGIARRIAFRYRRSADARARRLAEPRAGASEGIDEPFTRVHAAHSLAAMLDRIDSDKRAVFVLREVEGMTAPEVADALGIPLGTTYSRLRAAWRGLGQQAEREQNRLRRELRTMRAAEPSADRRRHMWGLIVGGIGPAPGAAPISSGTEWLAQVKWLVVGAALGTGLLGARAAVVATSQPTPEPSMLTTRNTPPPPEPPRPFPDASATQATPTRSPSIDVAPPPAPAALPSPRGARSERPASGSSRPTPLSTPPSTPPSMVDADALTAELTLLQRAQQAIREGRGDAALTLLDEHERRFARGQLVDERRRTRVKALCLAGRRDAAAREARAIGRDPRRVCP